MSLPKTFLLLLSAILLFAAPALAMSAQGCGGECASCHKLTLQEANQLLKNKNIGTVKSVKPAPVRGLYELSIVQGGQTVTGYLDYGKKHLIGGQIFDLTTGRLAGAPPETKKVERINPSRLSSKDSLLMGNPRGKKKLFVFTDPECPFCAKLHGELKKLVAMEPNLAIYIKLYPLKMHPKAYDKARVILGAKSLALLERSLAGGALAAPGPKDAKKPVDDTIRFAQSIGINSTPTLVLPDGRVLPGYQDVAALRQLLR